MRYAVTSDHGQRTWFYVQLSKGHTERDRANARARTIAEAKRLQRKHPRKTFFVHLTNKQTEKERVWP